MKKKLKSSEVPDLILERYALGELPIREKKVIQEAIINDNILQDRLDEITRSNLNIQKEYHPKTMAHLITARSKEKYGPKLSLVFPRWLTPLLTGCLVLLTLHFLPIILLDQSRNSDSGQVNSEDRIKGLDPFLKLFRKTDSGSELLESYDLVREGDLIRLGYQAAGARFGTIISIDGRGSVFQHFPRTGNSAAELGNGEMILLDFSYELDDAPHWEHFYFVTSQNPFSLDLVLNPARERDRQVFSSPQPRLKIDSKLHQFVISLQKEVK